MMDAVEELKARARVLHKRVMDADPEALARFRVVAPAATACWPDVERVQRKHCLELVAVEVGLDSWRHALRLFGGDPDERNFGKLFYPRSCVGFLTQWFLDHDEASAYRSENGGYLLAYQRQFVVVQAAFIRAVGLDPEDADWAEIGWDIPRPKRPEPRKRLYAKLLTHRPSP